MTRNRLWILVLILPTLLGAGCSTGGDSTPGHDDAEQPAPPAPNPGPGGGGGGGNVTTSSIIPPTWRRRSA